MPDPLSFSHDHRQHLHRRVGPQFRNEGEPLVRDEDKIIVSFSSWAGMILKCKMPRT